MAGLLARNKKYTKYNVLSFAGQVPKISKFSAVFNSSEKSGDERRAFYTERITGRVERVLLLEKTLLLGLSNWLAKIFSQFHREI